jgi:hypothetical protein
VEQLDACGLDGRSYCTIEKARYHMLKEEELKCSLMEDKYIGNIYLNNVMR